MMLTATIPTTIGQAEASNLISNATFDRDTTGWNTYYQTGGVCSLGADSGRLALKVSATGDVTWAVQVYYDIIPLYQNGVYRLKYDISSTVNRTVDGMIQQNGGDYQANDRCRQQISRKRSERLLQYPKLSPSPHPKRQRDS